MYIISISIMISIVVLCGTFIFYTIYNKKNIEDIKFQLKDKELELDKYKLFTSIDTKLVREEIDNMVSAHFHKYMTYNFRAKDVNYIKEIDANRAMKDITREIVLEITELYSFYLRLLYNIEDEDDLTKVIYTMVQDLMIVYIAQYNKPKEREEL